MEKLAGNRRVTHEFVAWACIDPDQTIAPGSVLFCKPIPAFSAGQLLFEFGYSGKRCVSNEYALATFTETLVP
jgi:hypothetical protein